MFLPDVGKLCRGKGGGASLGGPFNEIDDADDVCDVGDSGEFTHADIEVFDAFRIGEPKSVPLFAANKMKNIIFNSILLIKILYQF